MLIRKAEFARRLGVSPAAVGKACRSGRLNTIDGKLDEKVARLQWELNRKRPAPVPVQRQADPPRPAAVQQADPIENTALWITLNWDRAALPDAARNWLEMVLPESPDDLTVNALVALLTEIGECVDRIRNPEPDEDD